jgi:hypothetical protein
VVDPDLFTQPPKKLLSIDWSKVRLLSDADALAVWGQIAPTGEDWDAKLEEVPADAERPLAIALLRSGNFLCAPPPPPRDCARPLFDVPQPAASAGLNDPCLRRLLALWAIDQLEPEDIPTVNAALIQIAQLPPPESQLVAAAIEAVPERDHAARLAIIAAAYKAGQTELANGAVSGLDDAGLVEAVTKLHIDGALDGLAAQSHRKVFLGAVTDEALAAKARVQAIDELATADAKLADDTKQALVTATKSADCTVAAAAARALALRGDARFVPKPPVARTPAAMMRALCVLASYEQRQRADETSLLGKFVPPKGLERVTVTYDALSDVDDDGDGDPHTRHTIDLVPKSELVVPEVEDLVRAMRHCKGTTCTSDDRQYVFKLDAAGRLYRLELIERPPCPRT